ncbi:short chain dehydrogenase isoform X4 [Nasonia vitripennis]|nr:short chain dehydrogenase isoform X4 [Nasonia vitripennis]XP_032452186.1 short chain dehydrogenase isoform X4 [Nasonia vitripennis]XP_032452187.1 short chain dehydrogenase isoform X4 [Nasonia vitripennis]XP_032452188.1 short chain dehydrogenase isoform X4 [Nasonia vitripennis]
MDVLTAILIALVILLLLNPAIEFAQGFWGFLVKLCKFKTIDLRKTYGDWAVITGCTDGIGKEYAKELAKRKMNLVLISRSLDKLNKTKEEIQVINPTIDLKIIQADFSKGKEELSKIKSQLQNIPVGILVNNVGKLNEYPMYLEEYKEEDLWDIINLNITSSFVPLPLQSVYSASKSYVNFFSDALREEYSTYGLTIQCLTPFYIDTQMIGYSKRFKNNPFVPDPATFARSAIETLGKINSTTGYWVHDILLISILILPMWFRLKIAFFINKTTRRDYFIKQKEKVVE